MGVEPVLLELTERGQTVVLRPSSVLGYPLERTLQTLAAHRIIGLRESPAGFIVEPHQYVGEIVSGSTRVSIAPKSPSAFNQMQSLARSGRRRELAGFQVRGLDGDEEALDPRQVFAIVAEETAAAGLPFDYSQVQARTTSPRGRILFGNTLRAFAAVGIKHRSVCSVPRRALNSRVCDLILTAGDAALPVLQGALRNRLEFALSVAAENGAVISVTRAREFASTLKEEYSDRPDIGLLVDVADAVLREESDFWIVSGSLDDARFRFVDVDRMWEYACFEALRRVVDAQGAGLAEFHPLASSPTPLLNGGGPAIDPDMILFNGSDPPVVADAKNTLTKHAEASDVYQMFAYVARLSARVGLLIYLTNGPPWFEVLGSTNNGALLAAAGIGSKMATDLRDTLARATSLARAQS